MRKLAEDKSRGAGETPGGESVRRVGSAVLLRLRFLLAPQHFVMEICID